MSVALAGSSALLALALVVAVIIPTTRRAVVKSRSPGDGSPPGTGFGW